MLHTWLFIAVWVHFHPSLIFEGKAVVYQSGSFILQNSTLIVGSIRKDLFPE